MHSSSQENYKRAGATCSYFFSKRTRIELSAYCTTFFSQVLCKVPSSDCASNGAILIEQRRQYFSMSLSPYWFVGNSDGLKELSLFYIMAPTSTYPVWWKILVVAIWAGCVGHSFFLDHKNTAQNLLAGNIISAMYTILYLTRQ